MKRLALAFALIAAVALVILGGAIAAIVQRDGLRITVLSQVLPYKLPRATTAPIAVFVAGHIATPSGAVPPQLQRMTIKINRHGLLQSAGLPTCRWSELRATATETALAHCADALVGSGRFWATIVLPDQRPYPTRGRLLVFNGSKSGRRVLFAHIYTRKPFDSSFVITFAIEQVDDGPYGTQLSAALPQALGSWGFVDRIKLTLRRKYTFGGRHLSYFNASCPAPRGASVASYPLALASFEFAEGRGISLQVPKSCGVKE